jgi:ADP-ribose pyrophosphatase YjhB (NUDIX family)
MTDERVDAAATIAAAADQLRVIAANGLHFGQDPYDIERFHQVRAIAATLLGLVDSRSTVEIERIFHEEVGFRTPAVMVEGAIFDDQGRLLLAERADSREWCIPGGAADVGESPSAGAVREVREETGLLVRAERLLGAYDNKTWNLPSIAVHAYYLIFECVVLGGTLTPSHETTDFRWVTEAQSRELPLYRSHVAKVPEVFRLHGLPGTATAFH